MLTSLKRETVRHLLRAQKDGVTSVIADLIYRGERSVVEIPVIVGFSLQLALKRQKLSETHSGDTTKGMTIAVKKSGVAPHLLKPEATVMRLSRNGFLVSVRFRANPNPNPTGLRKYMWKKGTGPFFRSFP